MSLRGIAYRDLQTIVTDEKGWGWSVVLTDPAGVQTTTSALTTDVSQAIDPDTGALVSGRAASIALSTAELARLGVDLPEGIANSSSKPWTVRFDDINGASHTFKIAESNPDRAVGVVTCVLEIYG